MLSVLALLAIAYTLFAVAVWVGVDRLLFLPPPRADDGAAYLRIPVGDADTLAALWLPNKDARFAVLFSHGNAEDLATLWPFAEALRAAGFSVLAYDYRGYGHSTGRPTAAGALVDARAAHRHLTSELGVSPTRVILHGRSLGGGVTVPLAAEAPSVGVVLESTFTSAFRVVAPFPVLPFDRMASHTTLPRVPAPVLVIHGTADEVVPFAHGQRLHALATGPKQALWVEGAGHNDLLRVAGDRYWETIRRFAASLDSSDCGSTLPRSTGGS